MLNHLLPAKLCLLFYLCVVWVHPTSADTYLIGEAFKDCEDCPAMKVVPAGKALIGSRGPSPEGTPIEVSRAERPAHQVIFSEPFAVGVYEITRTQFAVFADATNMPDGERCFVWDDKAGEWDNRTGVTWRNPGFAQSSEHPVVCVSWDDATSYTRWLGEVTGASYRLLSETEWEYAARARTAMPWPWGSKRDEACLHANVNDYTRIDLDSGLTNDTGSVFQCRDGVHFTAPVGSFAPNAFGLFDMIGNVWEWTADCFNTSYNGAPDNESAWTTGDCTQRINRGGSWADPPWRTRSAVREWDPPHGRYAIHGFRVAKDLN